MTDENEEFVKQLRRFSESLEGLSVERLALLKSADGILGKILVGHLIAEELLTICLEIKCSDHGQLEKARLRFFQKLSLVRAFQVFPEISEDFWPLLKKLNELRNHLVHDIDQASLNKLSSEFVELVRKSQRGSAKLAKKFGLEKPVPITRDPDNALFEALHYTLGALQMITVWTNHLDALLMQSRKS